MTDDTIEAVRNSHGTTGAGRIIYLNHTTIEDVLSGVVSVAERWSRRRLGDLWCIVSGTTDPATIEHAVV